MIHRLEELGDDRVPPVQTPARIRQLEAYRTGG
jgi:hypothetical protein